ncbi:MAG: SDR family oxidoreductase [Deltaproteobacteria bacterium]
MASGNCSIKSPDTEDYCKNVIVTGGCGFIGSHLVERLLLENHRVTVLDNLITKKSNLHHLVGHPKLRIKYIDITKYKQMVPYFKNQEWVFHLAALADIIPSIDYPKKYYDINVGGTFSVLEACRKMRIRRILYAASSSCYGIAKQYPTSEEAGINPQYPYALTKYLGEQLALHWGRVYGLGVLSLRLFNVYGPRARSTGQYGAVFGVFLAQKRAGKPLTIVGDGTQTRDFTYVSDVVEAFIQCAKSDIKSEILNVASGQSHSVNELASMLSDQKVYIPKRPGEPDCTLGDISKIKKKLEWEPKVSFKEGISKMLDSIDLWRDAPIWTPRSIEKATKSWFHHLGKTP